MYLHIARNGKSKKRGKTNRKKAAYKAKKHKRRTNGMKGRSLGRRLGRIG